MTIVEAGHLGGYVAGGDRATTFPELWRWIVDDLKVGSVIDVGCGDGVAVDFFANLGVRVLGIDGVPQENDRIIEHDYTEGPVDWAAYPGWDEGVGLIWSCEFVEHVAEPYVPNFLETFRHGAIVLMTHADVGQPGYHHVNCRPADYWIGALAAIGYELSATLTEMTRAVARANPDPWNHYARSGLAFKRSG